MFADVPNRPRMDGIQCNNRDAVIQWTPSGDNRAPILTYTIQYNTSFTPDSWEVSFENVPATETRFKVEMSPWSNYTFRVIARNKIGPSPPSDHSSMCATPADVPYKNPDNVEGRGSTATNLVVTWNQMPEIEHNGRNFHYRVYWKRDISGEDWNIETITDWRQTSLLIANQPTFRRYRLKGASFFQSDLLRPRGSQLKKSSYTLTKIPKKVPKSPKKSQNPPKNRKSPKKIHIKPKIRYISSEQFNCPVTRLASQLPTFARRCARFNFPVVSTISFSAFFRSVVSLK